MILLAKLKKWFGLLYQKYSWRNPLRLNSKRKINTHSLFAPKLSPLFIKHSPLSKQLPLCQYSAGHERSEHKHPIVMSNNDHDLCVSPRTSRVYGIREEKFNKTNKRPKGPHSDAKNIEAAVIAMDTFFDVTCLQAADVQDELSFSQHIEEASRCRENCCCINFPPAVDKLVDYNLQSEQLACIKTGTRSSDCINIRNEGTNPSDMVRTLRGTISTLAVISKGKHRKLPASYSEISADEAATDLMSGNFGIICSKYKNTFLTNECGTRPERQKGNKVNSKLPCLPELKSSLCIDKKNDKTAHDQDKTDQILHKDQIRGEKKTLKSLSKQKRLPIFANEYIFLYDEAKQTYLGIKDQIKASDLANCKPEASKTPMMAHDPQVKCKFLSVKKGRSNDASQKLGHGVIKHKVHQKKKDIKAPLNIQYNRDLLKLKRRNLRPKKDSQFPPEVSSRPQEHDRCALSKGKRPVVLKSHDQEQTGPILKGKMGRKIVEGSRKITAGDERLYGHGNRTPNQKEIMRRYQKSNKGGVPHTIPGLSDDGKKTPKMYMKVLKESLVIKSGRQEYRNLACQNSKLQESLINDYLNDYTTKRNEDYETRLEPRKTDFRLSGTSQSDTQRIQYCSRTSLCQANSDTSPVKIVIQSSLQSQTMKQRRSDVRDCSCGNVQEGEQKIDSGVNTAGKLSEHLKVSSRPNRKTSRVRREGGQQQQKGPDIIPPYSRMSSIPELDPCSAGKDDVLNESPGLRERDSIKLKSKDKRISNQNNTPNGRSAQQRDILPEQPLNDLMGSLESHGTCPKLRVFNSSELKLMKRESGHNNGRLLFNYISRSTKTACEERSEECRQFSLNKVMSELDGLQLESQMHELSSSARVIPSVAFSIASTEREDSKKMYKREDNNEYCSRVIYTTDCNGTRKRSPGPYVYATAQGNLNFKKKRICPSRIPRPVTKRRVLGGRRCIWSSREEKKAEINAAPHLRWTSDEPVEQFPLETCKMISQTRRRIGSNLWENGNTGELERNSQNNKNVDCNLIQNLQNSCRPHVTETELVAGSSSMIYDFYMIKNNTAMTTPLQFSEHLKTFSATLTNSARHKGNIHGVTTPCQQTVWEERRVKKCVLKTDPRQCKNVMAIQQCLDLPLRTVKIGKSNSLIPEISQNKAAIDEYSDKNVFQPVSNTNHVNVQPTALLTDETQTTRVRPEMLSGGCSDLEEDTHYRGVELFTSDIARNMKIPSQNVLKVEADGTNIPVSTCIKYPVQSTKSFKEDLNTEGPDGCFSHKEVNDYMAYQFALPKQTFSQGPTFENISGIRFQYKPFGGHQKFNEAELKSMKHNSGVETLCQKNTGSDNRCNKRKLWKSYVPKKFRGPHLAKRCLKAANCQIRTNDSNLRPEALAEILGKTQRSSKSSQLDETRLIRARQCQVLTCAVQNLHSLGTKSKKRYSNKENADSYSVPKVIDNASSGGDHSLTGPPILFEQHRQSLAEAPKIIGLGQSVYQKLETDEWEDSKRQMQGDKKNTTDNFHTTADHEKPGKAQIPQQNAKNDFMKTQLLGTSFPHVAKQKGTLVHKANKVSHLKTVSAAFQSMWMPDGDATRVKNAMKQNYLPAQNYPNNLQSQNSKNENHSAETDSKRHQRIDETAAFSITATPRRYCDEWLETDSESPRNIGGYEIGTTFHYTTLPSPEDTEAGTELQTERLCSKYYDNPISYTRKQIVGANKDRSKHCCTLRRNGSESVINYATLLEENNAASPIHGRRGVKQLQMYFPKYASQRSSRLTSKDVSPLWSNEQSSGSIQRRRLINPKILTCRANVSEEKQFYKQMKAKKIDSNPPANLSAVLNPPANLSAVLNPPANFSVVSLFQKPSARSYETTSQIKASSNLIDECKDLIQHQNINEGHSAQAHFNAETQHKNPGIEGKGMEFQETADRGKQNFPLRLTRPNVTRLDQKMQMSWELDQSSSMKCIVKRNAPRSHPYQAFPQLHYVIEMDPTITLKTQRYCHRKNAFAKTSLNESKTLNQINVNSKCLESATFTENNKSTSDVADRLKLHSSPISTGLGLQNSLEGQLRTKKQENIREEAQIRVSNTAQDWSLPDSLPPKMGASPGNRMHSGEICSPVKDGSPVLKSRRKVSYEPVHSVTGQGGSLTDLPVNKHRKKCPCEKKTKSSSRNTFLDLNSGFDEILFTNRAINNGMGASQAESQVYKQSNITDVVGKSVLCQNIETSSNSQHLSAASGTIISEQANGHPLNIPKFKLCIRKPKTRVIRKQLPYFKATTLVNTKGNAELQDVSFSSQKVLTGHQRESVEKEIVVSNTPIVLSQNLTLPSASRNRLKPTSGKNNDRSTAIIKHGLISNREISQASTISCHKPVFKHLKPRAQTADVPDSDEISNNGSRTCTSMNLNLTSHQILDQQVSSASFIKKANTTYTVGKNISKSSMADLKENSAWSHSWNDAATLDNPKNTDIPLFDRTNAEILTNLQTQGSNNQFQTISPKVLGETICHEIVNDVSFKRQCDNEDPNDYTDGKIEEQMNDRPPLLDQKTGNERKHNTGGDETLTSSAAEIIVSWIDNSNMHDSELLLNATIPSFIEKAGVIESSRTVSRPSLDEMAITSFEKTIDYGTTAGKSRGAGDESLIVESQISVVNYQKPKQNINSSRQLTQNNGNEPPDKMLTKHRRKRNIDGYSHVPLRNRSMQIFKYTKPKATTSISHKNDKVSQLDIAKPSGFLVSLNGGNIQRRLGLCRIPIASQSELKVKGVPNAQQQQEPMKFNKEINLEWQPTKENLNDGSTTLIPIQVCRKPSLSRKYVASAFLYHRKKKHGAPNSELRSMLCDPTLGSNNSACKKCYATTSSIESSLGKVYGTQINSEPSKIAADTVDNLSHTAEHQSFNIILQPNELEQGEDGDRSRAGGANRSGGENNDSVPMASASSKGNVYCNWYKPAASSVTHGQHIDNNHEAAISVAFSNISQACSLPEANMFEQHSLIDSSRIQENVANLQKPSWKCRIPFASEHVPENTAWLRSPQSNGGDAEISSNDARTTRIAIERKNRTIQLPFAMSVKISMRELPCSSTRNEEHINPLTIVPDSLTADKENEEEKSVQQLFIPATVRQEQENAQRPTGDLSVSNLNIMYQRLQKNYSKANEIFHSNWILANQNNHLSSFGSVANPS